MPKDAASLAPEPQRVGGERWTSVLFTPGTRPDRVAKAWQGGAADVVVMDLEDAVAPDQKDPARADAVRVLREASAPPGTLRAVRVNALGSTWGKQDLDAVLPELPDLVVVPKAEEADAVTRLSDRIEREGGHTRLLLIIESARGVLAAPQLAACPGVAAVAFGAEDLAADAGMRRSDGNLEVSVPRALVALAAAAARVPAVDMVTADLADLDRFRREALEARGLGYRGKMCLHPDQVRVAREAFAPTAQEVAWAREVVAASADGGVAVVRGGMVDAPLLAQARRILADHEAAHEAA